MKIVKSLLFVAILACYGCTSSSTPPAPQYQGRDETKKLQGADAVGYDGTAVRKTVDGTLDKTDAHGAAGDKALKDTEK